MASNEYHFISEWQVEGTEQEASAIMRDTASLPRWWPSVYLAVTELQGWRIALKKWFGCSRGVGCLVPWTGHHGLRSRGNRMDSL